MSNTHDEFLSDEERAGNLSVIKYNRNRGLMLISKKLILLLKTKMKKPVQT